MTCASLLGLVLFAAWPGAAQGGVGAGSAENPGRAL